MNRIKFLQDEWKKKDLANKTLTLKLAQLSAVQAEDKKKMRAFVEATLKRAEQVAATKEAVLLEKQKELMQVRGPLSSTRGRL